MSDAAPRRLRDRLDPGVLVAVVVSALLAVAWWSTAVSTSMARSAVSSEARPIIICAPMPPQPTSTSMIAPMPRAAGR